MSCLDVMYQSAYQPYQHYPFYQRHFTQKFGHYKMQEPPDHDPSYTPHTQSVPPATSTSTGYSSSLYHHHHALHSHHGSPPANASGLPHQASVKKEDKPTVEEAEPTVEAEYINSRCVLFTYYTGELNKVVDEHFSRALSQPSSFPPDGRIGVSGGDSTGSQGKQSDGSTWNSKNGESAIPLMCQRDLPASFWNSNYYNHIKYPHPHHHPHHSTPISSSGSSSSSSSQGPTSNPAHPGHHEPLFTDPYPSPLHHRPVHHQPDPWHYPFVSQGSYSHHHRSGLHDLSYGMSSGAGSAFNPRYSSLLIQPSVRSGRLPAMPGQCDFTKGSEGWPSGYSHGHSQQLSTEITSYGMESASTSALEASDTSKDLYWF
ncbi:transcription cofactor vestigial-like protein 2 isoform X2 [Acanthaster planci]|uniref:Transcription cofactor vestigial-like protein 2 isoform X2 n=1 Tax=Acanthaster planci TaxID=133434 RepID=A0A8B7Z481_ACAPL|nr:transcription cofactor vestigial-like protein 2 isoform X2 [Acanthaster planci]